MRKVIFMLAVVGIVSGLHYMAGEAADVPPFSVSDAPWRTDFSRHTVPLEEIVSGGPPRDGIPPIDEPVFVAAAQADAWLGDREPVIAVQHGGAAKAYPLQILIWHEIVNDTLGDEPLAVTFCPCATAPLPSSAGMGRGCWISGRRGACGTATWSCGTGRRNRGGSS